MVVLTLCVQRKKKKLKKRGTKRIRKYDHNDIALVHTQIILLLVVVSNFKTLVMVRWRW